MPNTLVAVSVKPWRIWFIPKFITEPMPFITMEGKPTVIMLATVRFSSLRYFLPN